MFRGSRDIFTAKKFHEICDNQTRTVTVIKVKDSSEILGGYNPMSWKSDKGWSVTKDSFIFSFNNEDHILSRVMDENKAILNNPNYGPSFGESDLHIWPGYSFNLNNCRKSSYERPIRQTKDKFDVEECEVFQVI